MIVHWPMELLAWLAGQPNVAAHIDVQRASREISITLVPRVFWPDC